MKVNLEVSCSEMHQIISKNKELMEQIVSSAKYLSMFKYKSH